MKKNKQSKEKIRDWDRGVGGGTMVEHVGPEIRLLRLRVRSQPQFTLLETQRQFTYMFLSPLSIQNGDPIIGSY